MSESDKPSRDLSRDLVSLDRLVTVIMDERDRRYEQRFLAQEAAVSAAFKAADNALAKVDAATVRDKIAANEWRDAMNDREKNFIGRPEFSAELQAIKAKIETLAGTRGAGLNAAWGYFLGAVGVLVAIAAVVVDILVHR